MRSFLPPALVLFFVLFINSLSPAQNESWIGDNGSGSLTSQRQLKKWNHQNELLVRAAEPLAAMANWLGGQSYPYARINQAWSLILNTQQEDILRGGASLKINEIAWNDQVLGMNIFASVLESSAGCVTHAMDTRTTGKALVVYNPVAIQREDVVEATLQYPEGAPENIAVTGPDGVDLPFQVTNRTKNSISLIILAKVPAIGLICLDIHPVKTQTEIKSSLVAGTGFIENEYYKVSVNAIGDISGILDKKINKELLSAPARLEFLQEHPEHNPALNMDWSDRKNPPVGFVDGNPRITLAELGPVKASLKIERTGWNSEFTQFITLYSGEAGKQVIFKNIINWQSKGVCLKASFPLSVSNRTATYYTGSGTIDRSVNNKDHFEFPTRNWIDLTDKSGTYGISLLNESIFGSDFPNEKTLRLTLLYTPGANVSHDQSTQDWGTHEIVYSLFGHKGDWSTGKPDFQSQFLNQPLLAFQVPSHPGFLGKSFSILKISSPQVDVKALKNAESGGMVIVRLQEMTGKDVVNAMVSLPGKILSAYETDGQEHKTGDAEIKDGKLVLNMKPFDSRSFALKLEPPVEKENEPVSFKMPLDYNEDVLSNDKNWKNGAFCPGGSAIPAELFPDLVKADGVEFKMGSRGDSQNNALSCRGQKIIVPKNGNFNHLYILASADSDTNGIFRIGDAKKVQKIQGYCGYIGQYDKRTWDHLGRIKSLEPGFIKRDEVVWYASHMHKDSADQPFHYGYLFKYEFGITPFTRYIQLPENPTIKIFAITLSDQPADHAVPVQPLYDDFSGRKTFSLKIEKRIVSEDFIPKAKIIAADNLSGKELPCKVSMNDYADMHSPNGVTVKYYYSGVEKIKGTLPPQGEVISSYTDGMFDLLPSDSVKDVWFHQGEGRLILDLQGSLAIDSIHLFSTLDTKRGPQVFSIWSSDKKLLPKITGDPAVAGWSCLARSVPPEVTDNGKILYTVIPDAKNPLTCRYLLWVSEESWHGPCYFREIDVFEKQK